MNISLNTVIEYITKFVVTLGMVSFPLGAFFGFKFYGFAVIAVLGFTWFIMAFPIDIALWYRVARHKNIANSGIMGDGLVVKIILFILVALAVSIAGILSYVSDIESIGIGSSITAIIILLILMFREFMSIVENMAVLEPEEKKKSLWLWLAKMMGISVEIVRLKVEKKVDDLINNK